MNVPEVTRYSMGTRLPNKATLSQYTHRRRAEIIIKDNAELIGVLEEVNAMDGVRDTVWSEIVRVVGKKRSIPSYIINRF